MTDKTAQYPTNQKNKCNQGKIKLALHVLPVKVVDSGGNQPKHNKIKITIMSKQNRRSIKPETIKAIKALGFNVYMRAPSDSYLYYESEAGDIGYLQSPDTLLANEGFELSTAHHQNRQTGTGFAITDRDSPPKISDITKEVLDSAFIVAPSWATSSDRTSVRKYQSMAEYKSQNSFNAEFAQV